MSTAEQAETGIDPEFLKVELRSNPPAFLVDGVDITRGVERIVLEVGGDTSLCQFTVLADVEIDFPCTEVVKFTPEGGDDWLAKVTAGELEQVMANAGFSSSPAQAILTHLRQASGAVAS